MFSCRAAYALCFTLFHKKEVVEAEVPETLQGYIFYNLACFYATHTRLEKAAPVLQQAFTLYPPTREFARTDPDLVALHPNQLE